jgi:hypothetical protein
MRNGFDRESNPQPQWWQALMLISNIDLTTAPLWQPYQVLALTVYPQLRAIHFETNFIFLKIGAAMIFSSIDRGHSNLSTRLALIGSKSILLARSENSPSKRQGSARAFAKVSGLARVLSRSERLAEPVSWGSIQECNGREQRLSSGKPKLA